MCEVGPQELACNPRCSLGHGSGWTVDWLDWVGKIFQHREHKGSEGKRNSAILNNETLQHVLLLAKI
jgi:hypothetical protein